MLVIVYRRIHARSCLQTGGLPEILISCNVIGKNEGKMSVSISEGTVTLDGRIDNRNILASESFTQVQWILYMRDIWHRITVFDGWRLGKDHVLKVIYAAVAPEEMIAFLYQQEEGDAVFFVNHCGRAIRKLCQTNLNVHNPHGRKLVLQIQLRYPMMTKICMKSILTRVISTNMYNPAEKSLSLWKFHKDPELDKWMYCPLNLRRIADEVLTSLSSLNILQTLRILNLSHNALTSVQSLCFLVQNAPNLRILDLRFNSLSELSCLGRLRGLQLHELILDGNPFCELYNEEAKYIEEVREIFPSIIKLDGVVLPPKGFLVNLKHYICDPEAIPLVEQFIPYYFQMYDGWSGSRTRLNLIGAYSKEALFSMSAAPCPINAGLSVSPQPAGRINKYFSESRNLLKMSDYIKTHRTLIHGREQIVKFLGDLPLTEHDRKSFSVDLTVFEERQVVMTVRGIFRELDNSENSLCSFSRMFVFWRNGADYFIANDMLFITNATAQQAEVSLKSLPPMTANPGNEADMQPNVDDKNYEIKQKMVEELAKATEMNLRWSRKCLVETEWDFQEALIIFMELYKEGTIPPEAFKLQ